MTKSKGIRDRQARILSGPTHVGEPLPEVTVEALREQVKQDMEFWDILTPDHEFQHGFDTAVRKYAEILGLLDAPLYEDWEDRI